MQPLTDRIYGLIPLGGITISELINIAFSKNEAMDRKRKRVESALQCLRERGAVTTRPNGTHGRFRKGVDSVRYFRMDDPSMPARGSGKTRRYVPEFRPMGAEYDLRGHMLMCEGMR